MTSPHTEADVSGPAAAQAAGSFCPLPYDLHPAISSSAYFENNWFTGVLRPGDGSAIPFGTTDTGVRNVMHFKNDTDLNHRLTPEEMYAAVCGDVDEIVFDTRTGNRVLKVIFPRLLTTREAVTELWRTHLEVLPGLLAEWETNKAEIARKQEAARIKQQEANARARELLYQALNEEQRATFTKSNYFDLIGSAGTRWRIGTLSYSGNVTWRREDGSSGGEFCGHCSSTREKEWLPTPDHNLAQLLHLRTDEVDWVNTAVLCDGDRPRAWWYARVTPEGAEECAYQEKQRREYVPPPKPPFPGAMTSGTVTLSGFWTITNTPNTNTITFRVPE